MGRNFKLLLLLLCLLAEVAIDVFKVVGISKSFVDLLSQLGVALFSTISILLIEVILPCSSLLADFLPVPLIPRLSHFLLSSAHLKLIF